MMTTQLSSDTKHIKGVNEYIQLRIKGMPEQLIKRKMMYDGIKSPEIDSFFVNVMPSIPIKPSQSKPSNSKISSNPRSGRSFKPFRGAPASQYISLDNRASDYHAPTLRNAPNGKLLNQTDSIRNVEYFKKLAEEKKSEQKRATEDSNGANSGSKRSPVFGQGLKSLVRSSQEGKDQSISSSSSSSNPPGFDFRGSPSEALVTPQVNIKKDASISSISTIAVKTANLSNSSGTGRRSEHSIPSRIPPPLPQNIQKTTSQNSETDESTETSITTSKGVKIPKLKSIASNNSSQSSSPEQSPRSPRSLGTAVRMLAAFKGLFSSSKKLTTKLKDDNLTPRAKSRLSTVPDLPTPLMMSDATASKSSSGEDESALISNNANRNNPPQFEAFISSGNQPSSSSSSRAPTPVAEKLANSVQQLREMESMMRTVEKIQTDRGRTRTMSDVRPRAASEARNSIVLDKFMAAVETIEENDENRPRDRRRSSVAERNSLIDMSGNNTTSARPRAMSKAASRRALDILDSSSPTYSNNNNKYTKRTTTALKVIEISFLQLKEMADLSKRVKKISTAKRRGTISAMSGKGGDGQRLSEVKKKQEREDLSRAVAKLKTDREVAEATCRKELISEWMAEILNDPSDASEAMAMRQQKQFDISVVMRSVEMIKSEVALPTDVPIISALRKSGTRVVADVEESSTKYAGRGVSALGRGPPAGSSPGRSNSSGRGGAAGRGRGGGGATGDIAFFLSRAASEAHPSPFTSAKGV